MFEKKDYTKEKMLTVKDIQELLGCGRNKAYQIVCSDTISKIKIGKQFYIPESEYNKWVQRNLNKEIQL